MVPLFELGLRTLAPATVTGVECGVGRFSGLVDMGFQEGGLESAVVGGEFSHSETMFMAIARHDDEVFRLAALHSVEKLGIAAELEQEVGLDGTSQLAVPDFIGPGPARAGDLHALEIVGMASEQPVGEVGLGNDRCPGVHGFPCQCGECLGLEAVRQHDHVRMLVREVVCHAALELYPLLREHVHQSVFRVSRLSVLQRPDGSEPLHRGRVGRLHERYQVRRRIQPACLCLLHESPFHLHNGENHDGSKLQKSGTTRGFRQW